MKNMLKLLAAFGATCLLTLTAFAADLTPAGTWKWTSPGRGGGPGFEMTLKLDLKDGALTGTMVGMQGPQGAIPDVAIGDASFKDGLVKFSVTREWNGNKRTSKYEGKLEGDTLKGFTERPNRDGALQKSDWVATRAK
ncbi:MAG: hypothetical protein PSV13_13945 [Lacunisphaera sp.]|nr:hypothetical protein [Lacunisphaera sp.]